MVGEPDVASMATERLEAELVEWSARLAAGMARWLGLLAEFDRRGAYEAWGCASCVAWVVWQCGLDPRSAREHLRVARALEDLPEIRAAMTAGELSFSRVRALTRVATPETEATLLMWARTTTAGQLERLVATWRRIGRLGDPARAHERRSFDWRHDDDGTVVVTVRLPGDAAEVLLAAVEACLDEPGEEPPEPIGARRADALLALVERAAGGEEPVPVELVVHTEPEALAVDPVARRLACDARHVRGPGGRRARLVRGQLRRAVLDRDQHCRFPGCASRRHLHAHHLRHWADGGATRLDNLVAPCAVATTASSTIAATRCTSTLTARSPPPTPRAGPSPAGPAALRSPRRTCRPRRARPPTSGTAAPSPSPTPSAASASSSSSAADRPPIPDPVSWRWRRVTERCRLPATRTFR